MNQPRSVRPHLVRETLAEYPDRESARRAEPLWIAPHLKDPLCKNSHAQELHEKFDPCDKKASTETRERLSESHKGMVFTDEHRAKISLALKGKTHTQETRVKIGLAQKGLKYKLIQCPHCGFIGGNNMTRYHFDNCKKKPQLLL